MDTDTTFLDEPDERLIALNCGSPDNIAHYIASLHREIVKLWMRVDPERQRDPSHASSAICDFRPDSTLSCSRGTQGCGRWHEIADLRAQLAEREAELAALRSSERERLIRDACGAWDGGSPIADPMNSLTRFERARRANGKP